MSLHWHLNRLRLDFYLALTGCSSYSLLNCLPPSEKLYPILGFFICIVKCIILFMCRCVWMGMCMNMYVRSKTGVGSTWPHSPFLIHWGRVSPLSLEFTDSDHLISQLDPGSFVSTSWKLVLDVGCHTQLAIMWVLGIWTLVLIPRGKDFCPVTRLFSPIHGLWCKAKSFWPLSQSSSTTISFFKWFVCYYRTKTISCVTFFGEEITSLKFVLYVFIPLRGIF